MSLRNLRKLMGNAVLPAPDSDDEGDYEPLYARRPVLTYDALGVGSHSDSEEAQEPAENDVEEVEETPKVGPIKKKSKKKKSSKNNPKEHTEVDEVEKLVKEVNALIGSPPAAPEAPKTPEIPPADIILATEQKHLNFNNEMRQRLGSGADDEDIKKKRGRGSNLQRLLSKKTVIVAIPENIKNLTRVGLSMSLVNRDAEGRAHFVLDHTRQYQRMHRMFLYGPQINGDSEISLPDLYKRMHLEELIEVADFLFKNEENQIAGTLIEHAIAYVQFIAHPSFRLTDNKTRLEYKYLENRPVHVALLKFAYLVSSRGCHRTALELCKLLLKLDPSDPLAVLSVVDTFALRARAHRWLLAAVHHWRIERDARYLFNLQYSFALAQFRLLKDGVTIQEADESLQNAILQFPTVVIQLLQCASITPSSRLLSHPLYTTVGEQMTMKCVKDQISLYAQLVAPMWRERDGLTWLQRNAEQIADNYDKDIAIEEDAREYSMERMTLFRMMPEQVKRHISVIYPMSALLLEGPRPGWGVPLMGPTRSFNPHPPAHTVDRYVYMVTAPDAQGNPSSAASALVNMFTSLMPYYRWARERGEDGAVLPQAQPWPPQPQPWLPQRQAAQGQAAHGQAAHGQAAHGQAAQVQAAQFQATHGQAAHGHTAQDQAAQGQATQGQAIQGQAIQGQPAQGQAIQGQPAHGQHAHCQAAQGQAAQDQATQGQAAHGQTAQGQAIQGQAIQGQPAHGQPAQGQAIQGQPAHGQPAHCQAAHGQTAQGQAAQVQATQGQAAQSQADHGQAGQGQRQGGPQGIPAGAEEEFGFIYRTPEELLMLEYEGEEDPLLSNFTADPEDIVNLIRLIMDLNAAQSAATAAAPQPPAPDTSSDGTAPPPPPP